MLPKTTTAAVLIGLASSSLVAAAPTWSGSWPQNSDSSSSKTTSTPSYTWDTSFQTEVSPDGDKFRYPLSNSFPTPNPQQLTDINKAAGGTLSNNTPPPSISADGITNLQLVAFNELFEVAFFTSLLQNVTSNVPGYEVPAGYTRDFLIETLTAVQAQEELHALNANNGLKNIAKVAPISPCEYTFPVANLDDAIALAQTFTDVVLGTLQDVITVFANAGDDAFVRGVAASLGNEGEQNGFYRALQGKRPSAQPFLTASARSFAFSALVQTFVVPGTCPDVNSGRIALDVYAPLVLLSEGDVEARDQVLTFSFGAEGVMGNSYSSSSSDNSSTQVGGNYTTEDLKLVLINGQNKPIVNDLSNVVVKDGTVTFQGPFDFEENLLFGLTIAVVAKDGDLSTVNAVEKATVFGPALIEVL